MERRLLDIFYETEPFRLENTFKITKSRHQPDLLSPITKPCPLILYPQVS